MLLYDLLLHLLSPLLLLLTLIDAKRRGGGFAFIRERFGFFKRSPANPRLWFHAASIGEVQLALPLIAAFSSKGVLLTCNTPEAFRLAKKQLSADVDVHFCPLDFSGAVNRLLSHYQPSALFVVETELWPRLFAEAHRRRIGIYIINGRIGHKTSASPRFLKKLYRQALAQVTYVWAREPIDQQRFIALGCPEERISTVGDIKLSRPENAGLPTSPLLSTPYSLAISTHHDEEQRIARAWMAAGKPNLLVIIPRHPPRAANIAKELADKGLICHRRSESPIPPKSTDVYLVDTVGEVASFCAHSEFVFVGGSLVPVGGHNVMEPAMLGKAVLTGPHTITQGSAVAYLSENNAIAIATKEDELASLWQRLSTDNAWRQQLEASAKRAIDKLPDRVQIYREQISRVID